MWFKNLIVYTFTEPFNLSDMEMSEALKKREARDCESMQESSFGWVPPYKGGELFCEQINGCLFFTAQIQTKEIKAAALNEQLQKKLDEIETKEGRRPGRKERDSIKEELRAQMLPKAFPVTKQISAYIDLLNQRLVVNASSEKMADDFTAHLREQLGTLQIVPFGRTVSGADLLTAWYTDPTLRIPETDVEADLELVMVQDPTVKARYKNLDHAAPEIQQSLDSGMRVKQMGMSLTDRFSFVINEKLQIKRIKYVDALVEKGNDSDDPRTDALLMTDSVNQLLIAISEQIVDESKAE